MDHESLKSARFFKLYTSVSNRIYSYLMIMVHDIEDAEELVQETATVLWTKFDEYEDGTNFGAWAISIARLKALEFLRKRRRSQMVFDDSFYELLSDRTVRSSEDLPGHIEALKKCLGKLRKNEKKLLSMRFKKNMSIKNISQIAGRPVGSLYHQFSRLTRGLRSCIENQLAQQMR